MAGGPIHCQVEGRPYRQANGIRYSMPPPSSRAAPFRRNWRRARPARRSSPSRRRACVHGDLVIVLHQDATDTWSSVEDKVSRLADRCLADGRPRTVNVVVGPEGGISEEEVSDFVGAGAQSVRARGEYPARLDGGPGSAVAAVEGVGAFRVKPRISLIRNSMEADFHHGQQGAASI